MRGAVPATRLEAAFGGIHVSEGPGRDTSARASAARGTKAPSIGLGGPEAGHISNNPGARFKR